MSSSKPGRRRSSLTVEDVPANASSADRHGEAQQDCMMICELLDLRTRSVVSDNPAIAVLADYILSNNIISRVLAMVAERREIKSMFEELLGPDGMEVSVRTAAKYVRVGEALSFYHVFLRTRQFGEVCAAVREALVRGLASYSQAWVAWLDFAGVPSGCGQLDRDQPQEQEPGQGLGGRRPDHCPHSVRWVKTVVAAHCTVVTNRPSCPCTTEDLCARGFRQLAQRFARQWQGPQR